MGKKSKKTMRAKCPKCHVLTNMCKCPKPSTHDKGRTLSYADIDALPASNSPDQSRNHVSIHLSYLLP